MGHEQTGTAYSIFMTSYMVDVYKIDETQHFYHVGSNEIRVDLWNQKTPSKSPINDLCEAQVFGDPYCTCQYEIKPIAITLNMKDTFDKFRDCYYFINFNQVTKAIENEDKKLNYFVEPDAYKISISYVSDPIPDYDAEWLIHSKENIGGFINLHGATNWPTQDIFLAFKQSHHGLLHIKDKTSLRPSKVETLLQEDWCGQDQLKLSVVLSQRKYNKIVSENQVPILVTSR